MSRIIHLDYGIPTAAAGGPDADFAARAGAAGVVWSDKLDTLAAPGATYDNYQAGNITLDTGVKTCGAASTKVRIPASVRDTSVGGSVEIDIGASYGEGSDLYVQWRQRFDSDFITALVTWNSTVKMVNTHGSTSTCQNTEVTVTNYPFGGSHGFVNAYHTCSGLEYQTGTSSTTAIYSCPADCLKQQGANFTASPNGDGYNCHYQTEYSAQTVGSGDGDGCFGALPDVWYTFLIHLHLVTRGGTTGNNFNMYVASGGGGYKQIQRVTDWNWPAGDDTVFDRVRIDTYMTEMPSDGDPVAYPCYTYYNELIVSSQTIAAPDN